MKKSKQHILRVMLLGASLFWMLLIFWFSAQNAHMSTHASDAMITLITKVLRLLTGKKIQFTVMTTYHKYIEFAVRKLAHMFIYFMLAENVMLLLMTAPAMTMRHRTGVTLILCVLYACSDELHQFFIDGRLSSARDVLIDTFGVISGIICALIIYCVCYTIIDTIHRKKSLKNTVIQEDNYDEDCS